MRARKGRPLLLITIAACVFAWALLDAALPPAGRRFPSQDQGQPSPVFTPAHRTALDAVREFFDLRPAPVQPIAFPHNVHLSRGMRCTDCHTSVEQGPVASIPGVRLCMMCHQVIAADRPEIKKVAAYLSRGEDIPWQRVYLYTPSAHVVFNHRPHLRAGIDCKACHGDMTRQTTAVRAINVNMGYCLNCHKLKKASTDCTTCHY